MKYDQEKRYDKIFQEEFYLLDIIRDVNMITYCVSGSTANIYNIKLKENNTLECNCPDGKVWAKAKKCVCKHICFILCKVVKIFMKEDSNDFYYFETLKLNEDDFSKLCDYEMSDNSCVVNEEYMKRYKLLMINIDKGEDIFIQKKEVTDEDNCAICFDDFMTHKNKNVECPTCHNVIHIKCIQKWLNMGKNNCVYCRSDIWKYFSNSNNDKYKNILSN